MPIEAPLLGTCPAWPVYGLAAEEKRARLEQWLTGLTRHHVQHCDGYRRILSARGQDGQDSSSLATLPFLPVRLFKEWDLLSVEPGKVVKTLTSSGTTSDRVSRIFLDRETAQSQTRALVTILQSWLGPSRLPMLIVDHPGVIRDRKSFSARGAGILGLSTFGRDHLYALHDEDMHLNLDAVQRFIERHRGGPVLVFGFTFMVWKYLVCALRDAGLRLDLDNAILVHSGGWKKLQAEAVDSSGFRAGLREWTGVRRVHDFYGMVEQVGSIFVECEQGYLHTPAFADVLIRSTDDWSVCPDGHSGLIQVLSALPFSYPGHNLLTEDVGTVIGEDDCQCGRAGKYFKVQGRIARAELRGCSDTHVAPRQRGEAT